MARLPLIEVCKADLFTNLEELSTKYPDDQVQHLLRLREMYAWFVGNPSSKDRQFIEESTNRFGISISRAYADLAVIKALLPCLGSASRDFHRYRFNEMILETYNMAKARKDTKTMEKAASSYAKYNRVDIEDEQAVPYDDIVIQPFIPSMDPRLLNLEPIPNLDERIRKLYAELSRDNVDIIDITYEEADLEENLFTEPKEEEVHG